MDTTVILKNRTIKLILEKYEFVKDVMTIRVSTLQKIGDIFGHIDELERFKKANRLKIEHINYIDLDLISTFNKHLKFINNYKVKNNFGDESDDSLIVSTKDLYDLDEQLNKLEEKRILLSTFLTEEEIKECGSKKGFDDFCLKQELIAKKKRPNLQKNVEVPKNVKNIEDVKSVTSLIHYFKEEHKNFDFINEYIGTKDKCFVKNLNNDKFTQKSFYILNNSFCDESNFGLFVNVGMGFIVFSDIYSAPTYKRHLDLKNELDDHFVTLNVGSLGSPSLKLDKEYTFLGSYQECLNYINSIFVNKE